MSDDRAREYAREYFHAHDVGGVNLRRGDALTALFARAIADARADERERCAKVIHGLHGTAFRSSRDRALDYNTAMTDAEAAIRAIDAEPAKEVQSVGQLNLLIQGQR